MNRDEDALARRAMLNQIRAQARILWRGPINVDFDEPSGDYFFGWPMLALEVANRRNDQAECRCVFANPSRLTQKVAVLRAVYWEGKAAREAIDAQQRNPTCELLLPARYVLIPIDHLNTWLSALEHVSLSLRPNWMENDALVRRIRVDEEYGVCVVEAVWHEDDGTRASLNAKWNDLWKGMTKDLLGEPPLTHFNEEFEPVTPKASYDFPGYRADMFQL